MRVKGLVTVTTGLPWLGEDQDGNNGCKQVCGSCTIALCTAWLLYMTCKRGGRGHF